MVALFRARMHEARARVGDGGNPDTPFMCRLTARAMARNRPFADVRFDVVLIMSIQLLPLALPYLECASRPVCILDLFDVESQKQRRISEILARNGSAALARMTAQEADKLAAYEQQHLARIDLVLACSDVDRREIERHVAGCNVRVVPNAVPAPAIASQDEAPPETDFLFVGALGYFPNADGIIFFCRDILPEIGQRIGRTPTLRVISHAFPRQLLQLNIPGVSMVSGVAALGPHYASARIAIAPLRAGSGTRLKILEAFSYRTPVVSTRLGAEGIDAIDGRHLLIRDQPKEFAAACQRLLEQPELGRAIADEAFRLVQSAYSFAAIVPQFRAILAAVSGGDRV
jgi:glycosyltransferase involved in cell wall biosynthesis